MSRETVNHLTMEDLLKELNATQVFPGHGIRFPKSGEDEEVNLQEEVTVTSVRRLIRGVQRELPKNMKLPLSYQLLQSITFILTREGHMSPSNQFVDSSQAHRLVLEAGEMIKTANGVNSESKKAA